MLTPSMTALEKQIVKALLVKGQRNQDIHALINTGRDPTVNFGRISDVKKLEIFPATDEQIERFRLEKSLIDLQTGLSPFENERLVRAREAMMLAIQIFNMPLLRFKVEVFAVLSNIAWTYLLHEFYIRQGGVITHKDGSSFLLGQMIKRQDVPITAGSVKNLQAMKVIRDAVEHKTLSAIGETFYAIFQANCLNFEKSLCELFGERVSLGKDLSYAIQISKMSIDQAAMLQKAEVAGPIQSIDAQLSAMFTDDEMSDPDFKFKVSYSLEKASKGDAHFTFSNKLGDGNPHNVLVQKVAADENWPHRASLVVKKVVEKTGKHFSSHNHTQAWRKLGVRPKPGSLTPSDTTPKFCTYHVAHNDYTYSDEWIDKLCGIVTDDVEFGKLKAFKL
jgi:hypothetical protein